MSFEDPKRPNTALDGFVQAVFQQIGIALGLPFEILVKHFTASYSAARFSFTTNTFKQNIVHFAR
jgi:capsid protein